MILPEDYERILLMGAPDTGKTEQMINVIRYLESLKVPVELIDLEDKMSKYFRSTKYRPTNVSELNVALKWEDFRETVIKISKRIKPKSWIMIDRIDLSWPMVQRWYTQTRYKESLSERMTSASLKMGNKGSRDMPRFDQGSWQVINENFETVMNTILYDIHCHVLLTSGIKGVDEDAPSDIFAALGVLPRGQKELGHQPHSVFLLSQEKVPNPSVPGKNMLRWNISTGKDLPKRLIFDKEELLDFSVQYLSLYYPE